MCRIKSSTKFKNVRRVNKNGQFKRLAEIELIKAFNHGLFFLPLS